MPALLAKYNISFLDALGRPPRVLPYDIFQSLEVDALSIIQVKCETHDIRFYVHSSSKNSDTFLDFRGSRGVIIIKWAPKV